MANAPARAPPRGWGPPDGRRRRRRRECFGSTPTPDGFPHFHARHADGEAKVRLDDVGVMDSSLGRRQLRLVLAWAELHQDELLENWRRARAGEKLFEIEPLR